MPAAPPTPNNKQLEQMQADLQKRLAEVAAHKTQVQVAHTTHLSLNISCSTLGVPNLAVTHKLTRCANIHKIWWLLASPLPPLLPGSCA